MAVGCLSELCQELDTATAEHWKSVFLPVILAGLADEDDNVKRNAAFCAGIACENLKEIIAADFPALLQALGPLFSIDTSSGMEATMACVDNSAAAVARMIMAAPHLVPLDQVLPVFLRALPLKVDTTENATVYKCLMGLMPMHDYASFQPEFTRIITEALAQEKLEEEIKGQLRQAAGIVTP
jgi:L-fucose mutarotase/ribose pyranase (RbsD/FucU family)